MEIVFKKDVIRVKSKGGVLETRAGESSFEILDLNQDQKNSRTFNGPGEYEVLGISVIGIQIEEKTAFVYEVDGLRIANLTGVFNKPIENKLAQLGDVDILIFEAGENSIEIIQQVEPYYALPITVNDGQEFMDKFLRESGLVVEKLPKFVLKKENIVEDSPTQVVLLDQN